MRIETVAFSNNYVFSCFKELSSPVMDNHAHPQQKVTSDATDSHHRQSGNPTDGGSQQQQADAHPRTGIRKSQSSSTSSSSSSESKSSELDDIVAVRSRPPTTIVIPSALTRSMSGSPRSHEPARTLSSNQSSSHSPSSRSLTREQLEHGPMPRPGEVQVLYHNPDADSNIIGRHVKEDQAKLVAPSIRQSPIAIISLNPTHEKQNKPLILEYPATVDNLRLNNTGTFWEVKLPYQVSLTTALYGAHLNANYRYRLHQFHCHWGSHDHQGSEHTIDNRHYSAELHFVHYNMDKYHTMSKAARHPDGLVVLSAFLDAKEEYHNHAELEKIVSHLRLVPLKGEHNYIKQSVRIENLLPKNRSYWSYQGSLTTAPYFESVTWFVLKFPIKCSTQQLHKFRSLKSSFHHENSNIIRSNHRKTQPLNGRTIVSYDEASSALSHY